MSDQIHHAPMAPHPTATSAQAPPTEASRANFSRPTTANGAAQNTTNTAQHVPATSAYPPATAQPEEPQTLNTRLNNADRYWKFKSILQSIAIIVGLIGIGTLGWCMSSAPRFGFSYGYDSTWSLWPSLLTFACSIIWCFACIAVLVFRKRPVHPGLRVAIDLILWLGFIVTALFAMVAFTELTQWGEYGDMWTNYGVSSSYGDYELSANGTWVWEQDSDYTGSRYARPCDRNSTSRSSSSYESMFANCEEQDAYINQLWREKPHRESVELTGVVCQFFSLVLHLALFIWACVDCHHHNRKKVSKDAEKLAASIVQTMITNGAVIPPPGQAHMRPWAQQQMGYYQLPPQQGQAYPMTTMYPQQMPMGQQAPQGVMRPAGGAVAGPSNEKSEGPRYA